MDFTDQRTWLRHRSSLTIVIDLCSVVSYSVLRQNPKRPKQWLITDNMFESIQDIQGLLFSVRIWNFITVSSMCRNTCWRNPGKALVGAACVNLPSGFTFLFPILVHKFKQRWHSCLIIQMLLINLWGLWLCWPLLFWEFQIASAHCVRCGSIQDSSVHTMLRLCTHFRFTLSLAAGIASIHAEVADSFLAVLARPRHQSPSQGRSAQWETGSWNQLEPDETWHQEDIPIYQQQFNNYQMKKGAWPKQYIHSSTLCQRNHQHWMWMWRSFRALPSSASWA